MSWGARCEPQHYSSCLEWVGRPRCEPQHYNWTTITIQFKTFKGHKQTFLPRTSLQPTYRSTLPAPTRKGKSVMWDAVSHPQDICHQKGSQHQALSRYGALGPFSHVVGHQAMQPLEKQYGLPLKGTIDLPRHPGSPLPSIHQQQLQDTRTQNPTPHCTQGNIHCGLTLKPPNAHHMHRWLECTPAGYNGRSDTRLRAHGCAHPLPEFHLESLSLSFSSFHLPWFGTRALLGILASSKEFPNSMQLAGRFPSQSPPEFLASNSGSIVFPYSYPSPSSWHPRSSACLSCCLSLKSQ